MGRFATFSVRVRLQLELDDLLPLVEAADLLDLADTQEGDLVLTLQGKRFAEAGVLEEEYLPRTGPCPCQHFTQDRSCFRGGTRPCVARRTRSEYPGRTLWHRRGTGTIGDSH